MTVAGRTVMVLPLRERCEHCGDELAVYLRRAFPDGRLQAAVSHSIGGYHVPDYKFKDIKGFDDLVRLPSGTERV